MIFPTKDALATVIGRKKIVVIGACVDGALLNFNFIQIYDAFKKTWVVFKIYNYADVIFTSSYYNWTHDSIVLRCSRG